MDKNKATDVKIPEKLLEPIKDYLEDEASHLKKRKKELEKADPFKDETRVDRNSLEDDVDEQIGHDDSQVKVKFLSRQIVQIRKALTRMKIGKYGVCEQCGQMIDTDRLAVRPESTLCISCSKAMDE